MARAYDSDTEVAKMQEFLRGVGAGLERHADQILVEGPVDQLFADVTSGILEMSELKDILEDCGIEPRDRRKICRALKTPPVTIATTDPVTATPGDDVPSCPVFSDPLAS